MLLTTFERLLLLNILPKQGDLTTIRIVRKLREDLSFSEAEHAALQFEETGEKGLRWIKDADTPKEVEIGAKARNIIADVLTGLDKAKQLTEEHLPLYERFVEAA